MQYEDFAVQLWAETEADLRVRVVCPQGEATEGRLAVPWDDEGWEAFRRFGQPGGRQQRGATGALESSRPPTLGLSPEDLGDRLFRLLFQGRVATLWERTRAVAAEHDNRGVRLRLTFDLRQPSVRPHAALPWELLYDRSAGAFLALDGKTPVVRYLDVPKPVRCFSDTSPWRVLVVAPRPSTAGGLKLEVEIEQIREIARGQEALELVFVESATVDGFRDGLVDGPIHAVYFMGHGIYDQRAGVGGLLLERDYGGAQPLRGKVLTELLGGIDLPSLFILNACETGTIATTPVPDAFAGAATALVAAGVPAVVAMQRPILDEQAIHFSRYLFSALQAGRPVDWAVSEARLRMHLRWPQGAGWAIPSLFTRVADGRILRLGESELPRESPASAPPPPMLKTRQFRADELNILNERSRGGRSDGPAASDQAARTLVEVEGPTQAKRANLTERDGRDDTES